MQQQPAEKYPIGIIPKNYQNWPVHREFERDSAILLPHEGLKYVFSPFIF